jgi:hypothetical protein
MWALVYPQGCTGKKKKKKKKKLERQLKTEAVEESK